jgi:hypothetical protein
MPASARERRIARVPGGELVAALSAIALCVLMFGVQWYGVAGVSGVLASRPAVSGAENAWHGLTNLRWVMLAAATVAVASFALRIAQRFSARQVNLSPVVMTLGSVTAALLVYRVLINPPAPGSVVDQKVGAFLGLLSALGIAFGGYDSRRETRKSRRRVVQRSRSS